MSIFLPTSHFVDWKTRPDLTVAFKFMIAVIFHSDQMILGYFGQGFIFLGYGFGCFVKFVFYNSLNKVFNNKVFLSPKSIFFWYEREIEGT